MKDIIDPINTSDGLFHDGDQSTGALGTIVTAKFQNDVQAGLQSAQSELISILNKASPGVIPDELKTDQVLKALQLIFLQIGNSFSEIASAGSAAQTLAQTNLGIVANTIPVGVPLPWPTATPPSGWIKCNGASFSKSLYPKLALAYSSGILPDLRGYFIRGWDDGRGVDSGRSVLSGQLPSVGSFQWSASTYSTVANSGSIIITDAITINGVSNDGAGVGTTNAVISPNDTRPLNVSYNYIVRAA